VLSGYGESHRVEPQRRALDVEEGCILLPDEARNRAELVRTLSELTRVVISEQTLDDLLQRVVGLARSTVDGVDGASISLRHDGGTFTHNATDDVVRNLDIIQYENSEGPCVDAINQGRQVAMAVGQEADRYPTFAPLASERFIAGILSTPFAVTKQPFGALNLYSSSVSRWNKPEKNAASLFAHQASALLANAAAYASTSEAAENLQRALENRDVIGQAKGLLMAQRGCSADEAFDILRRESQRANRKLAEIARELAEGRRRLDSHATPAGDSDVG
jgi:GAF domain-containing protein